MSGGVRTRRAAALVGLLCGLALFGFTAPRALAALLSIPADIWMERLGAGDTVSPDALRSLETARRRALALHPTARDWTDLALVGLMRLEQRDPTAGAPADEIDAINDQLRRGLQLAPARPFAWTRLARAALLTPAPAVDPVAALALSVRSAPASQRLRLPRIDLGLALWHRLGPELQDWTRREVHTAWGRTETRLAVVGLAVAQRRVPVLRVALLPDIDKLVRLEKILRRQASGAEAD